MVTEQAPEMTQLKPKVPTVMSTVMSTAMQNAASTAMQNAARRFPPMMNIALRFYETQHQTQHQIQD